mgnify:CR=1 FL=1
MFTTTYTTDMIYSFTEKDGKQFSIRQSSILHLVEADKDSTLIYTIDRKFEVKIPFNKLFDKIYKENK